MHIALQLNFNFDSKIKRDVTNFYVNENKKLSDKLELPSLE